MLKLRNSKFTFDVLLPQAIWLQLDYTGCLITADVVTVLTAAAAGYPVDPVLYLLFVIGAIYTYKMVLFLLIRPLFVWFWYSKLLPSKILIDRHTQGIQVLSNTSIVIVIGKLSSAWTVPGCQGPGLSRRRWLIAVTFSGLFIKTRRRSWMISETSIQFHFAFIRKMRMINGISYLIWGSL